MTVETVYGNSYTIESVETVLEGLGVELAQHLSPFDCARIQAATIVLDGCVVLPLELNPQSLRPNHPFGGAPHIAAARTGIAQRGRWAIY